MRSAERRTGLENWGERDFIHRLALWLASVASDRGLSAAGRRQVEEWTLQHACNRLCLEDLIARHPEIEAIEIEAPVIVSGLPRSGTTALARRIASQDPELRWLPYWESLRPFSGFYNERRLAARKSRSQLLLTAPQLVDMHDCTEDAFVDDTELQCLAFGSYALEWHALVPAWRDHYLSEDQEPVYRYMKRALKALSFLRGSRRWIIKSPQHIEQLQTVRKVFPDAELKLASRDRKAAERSMERVMQFMSLAFRSKPFPQTYWRKRFDVMLARYEEGKKHIEARQALEEA